LKRRALIVDPQPGRSLRERNEEIKRLKKQVEQLEGTQAQGELGTPPAEPDASAGPSLVAPAGTASDPDAVHSATSVMSTSDWMVDYLNVLPNTPGSDHDAFAGFSHAQVDAWGSDFASMGVAPEHLMQPVSEHGLDHAGATAEAARAASVSCCPQHHGESGGGGCTSPGSCDPFAYPSMPLGPEIMRHSRGGAMGTGDSTPSDSPTLKPYMFGGSTQRPRSGSRLNSYGTKDLYHDDDNSGRASPFSSHGRVQTGAGACGSYHEASHRSPTSAPWCHCKTGANHADYSVRGHEHQRQRTLIQPIDMDSLYTQGHFLHQGLLVEPSDSGDGVTIRLQPNAANGRASLVAFMIQHDPKPLNDTH
jgi:hypothetical protein